MAILIPDRLSTAAPPTERVFFEKLSKLDDTHTVFSRFSFVFAQPGAPPTDQEIDFLIISPRLGLVVIEVKGGSIEFRNGTWFQNGRAMDDGPFMQARNNMYGIVKWLKQKLGRDIRLPFSFGVCFPDVDSFSGSLPPDCRPGQVISGYEMRDINAALSAVAAPVIHHMPDTKAAQAEIDAIIRLLNPHFVLGVSLSRKTEIQEREVLRLTQEQCEVLEILAEAKRAAIRGCVGSGKTVMAFKKASDCGKQGMKTLLLCYNQPLAKRLQDLAVQENCGVITATYHAFCNSLFDEAGITVSEKTTESLFDTTMPRRVNGLLKKRKPKFDAIIVDEAQDFKDVYWDTVKLLLKPKGLLYCFYDPHQEFYSEGFDLRKVIPAPHYSLNTNCRNPGLVSGYCATLVGNGMKPRPGMPDGEPIEEITCKDAADVRTKVDTIVGRLVNNERIRSQQIVVVGGHSLDHTSLAGCAKLGPYPLQENADQKTDAIGYFTYMKFKGCEADFVIVIDVDRKDPRWAEGNALYTAVSRAKVKAWVIYKTVTVHIP